MFLASYTGPLYPEPSSLICFLLSAYYVPGNLSRPLIYVTPLVLTAALRLSVS